MRDAVALFVLVTVAAGALAACSADPPEQNLAIVDAWSRPTTLGQSAGVVYLTVTNAGVVDRLVHVAADIAEAAELHISETVDGVARMQPLDALAIPNGTPVRFMPGGLHIMLTGLQRPLGEGETYTLQLVFEKAGTIDVAVDVRSGGDWELRRPIDEDHGDAITPDP